MDKVLSKIKSEKKQIKKIDLSENPFTQVPPIIKECLKLESLDLSFTDIASIPDFVFKLPNLKKFSYLHCRELKHQPTGIKFASKLESLRIQIEKKQSIPPDVFKLKKLKHFVLSGEISHLPLQICEFENLEELELFNTKIKTLPKEIKKLSKLKKISFTAALFSDGDKIPLNLSEIFENLTPCPKLKELHLDNNNIKKIPTNISLLKQLQIFSAYDNQLTSFPKELYKLAGLKEINFSINWLKEIPAGIENLTKLKTLLIRSNWKNRLDTKNLFSVIDKLSDLETLDLQSCLSGMNIPNRISGLKKLKYLDVDNNLIKKLPEGIFLMTNLKSLRVSTNKIPAAQIDKLRIALPATNVIA